MTADQTPAVIGAQALGEGPLPKTPERLTGRPSPAAVASRLSVKRLPKGRPMLVLARDERRAEEIARALSVMAPRREVLVFPPLDSLPYDRSEPSRDAMGRRMAVLAALTGAADRPRLLVTSPEALMQRTAPAASLPAPWVLKVGDRLDRTALETFARRTGWRFDDRIDEPGEIALLGAVADLYPPAAARPVRLSLDEQDIITEIRDYDPATQRTHDAVGTVTLGAASEVREASEETIDAAEVGFERRLLDSHGGLVSLFDHMDDPVLVAEPDAMDRCDRVWAQIVEAHDTRRRFADSAAPPAPQALHLEAQEVRRRFGAAGALALGRLEPAPGFETERSPGRVLKAFIEASRAADRRVILTGAAHEQKLIGRLLGRHGLSGLAVAADWPSALKDPAGVVRLEADLDRGFVDVRAGLAVITASDIFGARVARRGGGAGVVELGETELRLGDVVIHEDHGLGVLEGLETVTIDGVQRDVLRLGYQGGASILAPVEEFGRIWRYGSDADAVTLDRLNSDGWIRRRAEASAQIDAAAEVLAERARRREATRTDPIVPPSAAYARFAAGFGFPESVDQAAAIEAVLEDLASGRPMSRLVCGDVGFGKTEVALRAAAAAVLSGRQVMVVAPTTVLARQHHEVFVRRFEGTGVAVACLSRAIEPAAAAEVKAGLADGRVRLVVGTQALAAEDIKAPDLGLVIIDEEHRFGAEMKAALAERAPHLLTLSATPIPRTLQGAMVGVQDVSLIASPPARRRPIRTQMADFDPAAVRLALLREKARGGQSFVIAPRVEDLAPLAERLAALAPELRVLTAHGRLKPAALDQVMGDFAAGSSDVLLATNIVENGLDVPRANTMIVWRPDRFGLAQLHQLRGRVGRGRRQGFAWLVSDSDTPIGESAEARLRTLEALDRLGAGFAISARDLDLRGGGDLVGDEQAGHIRLIGSALYHRVMARALRRARGEPDVDAAPPRLNLGFSGALPVDYVPDATVRINLYARLAQAMSAEAVDALHAEVEDRFGPPPDAVETLLAERRLSALAATAGVIEVTAGPKATAFRVDAARCGLLADRLPKTEGRRWSDDRLLVEAANDEPHDPAAIEALLVELAAA
ncbi:MAG: DEAD/DEAH box helicase [Brevundimonas sp.]|uniref:DEAD/DEAH box helicase n=1 Tax=Brevundimonas sp. TaxID=1871086 RepID=UPI00391BFB6A